MIGNNFLLWENDEFIVTTPLNPHLSYEEGLHVNIKLKNEIATAWQDPERAGEAFELATKVCKIIMESKLSPWLNIQYNGNWGLLPGGELFFHIHIYGRNRTANWGKPIVLPELPGTYHNDPMPESDRSKLAEALRQLE